MKSECKVIIPMTDNEGFPVLPKLREFEQVLAQRFGGYTETSGRGVWMSPTKGLQREQVKIYTIAAHWYMQDTLDLQHLMDKVGSATGQQEIYWVDRDGEAHFHKPRPPLEDAA